MTVERDRPVGLPWAPEDLPVPGEVLLERWSYIVLEEQVDELVLLRRWPWPVVDQLGRLAWPGAAEHDTGAATIDIDVLRSQLYVPNELWRRPRVGDVFAAEHADNGAGRWRNRHVADLRTLIDGPIYDISADAREAAKIAFQAGLAPIASPGVQDERDRAAQRSMLRARSANPLPRLRIADPDVAAMRGMP